MSAPIIIPGDCLAMLPLLNEASVDAIVTDPPYGLGFMGKAWDDLPPGEEWARECLRVLKPGGHLLAFGGTRTWHRLAVAVEDAGFEMRDSIAWLYGSGFPKSLDVSKAIDKAAGAERAADLGPGQWAHVKAGGTWTGEVYGDEPAHAQGPRTTAPATDDAQRWQGWGTALKPAFEPIVVARKPLIGTVAANVLAHGTGALHIDACRIEGIADRPGTTPPSSGVRDAMSGDLPRVGYEPDAGGRWPANVVLDESQAEALDEQSGVIKSGKMQPTKPRGSRNTYGQDAHDGYTTMETYGDSGGASRFFYVAKAPQKERPKLDGLAHPTVKPLTLMRWLVRLVTPPGGTVLDPFLGSGTTAEACLLEGFRCIGIEREQSYIDLIKLRLAKHAPESEAS